MSDIKKGYMRVATAVPRVHIANVSANVNAVKELLESTEKAGCDVTVFPECNITGYTVNDLFHQDALLEATREGIADLCEYTREMSGIACVGAPLRIRNQLYNCAVVIQHGKVLGVVPKSYIPGYCEYYEQRWFAPGTRLQQETLALNGERVPCGADLLFKCENNRACTFAVEICEDVWGPVPPSSRHALAGATVILNLSASNELVAKAEYRRALVCQQSGRCVCGYVMASAGPLESTTDVVFSGHALIAENGVVLKESERFRRDAFWHAVDIDVARLEHDRLQTTSFGESIEREREDRRIIYWQRENTQWTLPVMRPLSPTPFVPHDKTQRSIRCEEIFSIQTAGLARRIEHTHSEKMVIGLSGGLDSTLALLVCVHTCELLDISLDTIEAITMPGYGTSNRTLNNVKKLCAALSISCSEISIVEACQKHFEDIDHDPKKHDVVFENAQARERTQILMDRANQTYGIVIGTGDLSEIALGWCTYNADHISMYNVNCGVPKTLVKYLVEFVADTHMNKDTCDVLHDILDTPISPELLPADASGKIAQKTEDTIGPYELHDFFLYHIVRCGAGPRKVCILADQAFEDKYTQKEIKQWLRIYIRRFFASQFKRSCVPDGPKVGTVALSPRGDWRMPSDASAAVWLAQLD